LFTVLSYYSFIYDFPLQCVPLVAKQYKLVLACWEGNRRSGVAPAIASQTLVPFPLTGSRP